MQMQMQMHTMDEWNGRRLKSFMCLAVGSLLLILLLNYFYGERNPYSMDVLLGGFVARSSSSLTSMVTRRLNNNRTSDNCEPVRAVDDQYYATFDGVRYPRHVPLYHNRSIDFACLNADGQVKKILYWNGFFGDKSFEYGLGVKQPFVANNCPVTNCETFYDRQRIAESDLILVHMRDSVGQLPTPRGANERWVFALYESPVHAGDYSNLDGLFNLTSTYAVESDFPDFYSSDSKFRWQLNETFDPQHDYSAGKPGFAAAVVSNCGGPSRRLEYIKELQKHIAVDVFGNCGRKCPTSYRSSGQPGECKDILAHEYRFYFAFENSVCKDYITEKFFLILNKNIIPVVLGGGSYDYYVSVYICLLKIFCIVLMFFGFLDSQVRLHKCA